MSTVVTPAARRRWSVVVAGTAALVAVLGLGPRALAGMAVPPTTAPPEEVAARALRSADVAFSARGRSRGGLALPDLRGFGGLAALLGGTTDTRVWWQDPSRWRVDVVELTGERDTYGLPHSVTTWDYESRRLVTVVGDQPARLPRADDLVAPMAGRRLLGLVGPEDRLTALPAGRVGGRVVDVVRIVPGDARSTIAHADLSVDRDTGLPLRVDIVDGAGGTALVTELSDLRLGPPVPDVLTPPAPPIARRSLETTPDVVARVAARGEVSMPDRVAGLPVATSPVGGVATYGSGLVRVTVLPLPGRLAAELARGASSVGAPAEDVPGGSVGRIGSALLNAVVAREAGGRRAFVVAGLVQPDLLDAVALELLETP